VSKVGNVTIDDKEFVLGVLYTLRKFKNGELDERQAARALGVLAFALRDEVLEPIVRRLAAMDDLDLVSSRADGYACVFCDAYARNGLQHSYDCLWIEAKRLVES
jgi:hypothetical protein